MFILEIVDMKILRNRQQKYLNRSSKIKGEWKNDKYSPNNLSMNILWK